MRRAARYPPELRHRAMRLVREHRAQHPSEGSAIRSFAGKLGITTEAPGLRFALYAVRPFTGVARLSERRPS